MKKSFKLFLDSLDVLDELTDEQSGQLFKAIRAYEIDETEILTGLMKAIFTPFKNNIDRAKIEYITVCERNRANGAKGGRPNPKKPTGIFTNPNNLDKDKDKDKDKKREEYIIIAEKPLEEKAIDYLNKLTGKKFTYTSGNVKEIKAQIKKGATENDLKHVIDVKCNEWLHNSDMKKHLNPVTLFRESNFNKYLNQDFELKGAVLDEYIKARCEGIDHEDY